VGEFTARLVRGTAGDHERRSGISGFGRRRKGGPYAGNDSRGQTHSDLIDDRKGAAVALQKGFQITVFDDLLKKYAESGDG
jgi:hypothetical protein